MTNYHYHIHKCGSVFLVGTDEEEILICADRKVATQITTKAQETEPAEIAAFHALCACLKARALKSTG